MDLIENDRKNQKSSHKFYYYSAHDSSLNAFFVAFDIIDEKNNGWPPFAADIAIELWKNNRNFQQDDLSSKYFLKVFYCNQPLIIEKCNSNDNKIDINKFLSILKENGVDRKTYLKLCSETRI